MNPIRRVLNRAFGLILLGGIAFGAWSFGGAEHRVRQVCSDIRPGMSLDELNALARDKGFNQVHKSPGVVHLAESRSFGRWGCEVAFEAGRVASARYAFMD